MLHAYTQRFFTKLSTSQIELAQVKEIDTSSQSRLQSLQPKFYNLNSQLQAKQALSIIYHLIFKDLNDVISVMVETLQSKIDSLTNAKAAFAEAL